MNVSQARNVGVAFRLASLRCQEKRPLASGQFEMLLVPAIVCAAFSVEVGFKALQMQPDASPPGHDLASLFAGVPEAARSSIVSHVALPLATFSDSLSTISHSFVEWRYVYEGGSRTIDSGFLFRLLDAVNREVEASVK